MRGFGRVERGERSRRVAQVGGEAGHPGAGRRRTQARHGFVERRGVACHQADHGALGEETLGAGEADALAAASDQHVAVGELQVHGQPRLTSRPPSTGSSTPVT